MKNIFTFALILLVTSLSNAQKNNPFNEKGKQFFESIEMITTDYSNGKIKGFDKNTVLAYSKKVPIENDITMDIVGKTIKAVQTKTVKEVVSESKLSSTSQQIIIDMYYSEKSLTSLVDTVLGSKLQKEENELLLTMLAINNYYRTNTLPKSLQNRTGGCDLNGIPAPGACIAVGAIVGGSIGAGLCGVPCAIGGAIIGALAGAATE